MGFTNCTVNDIDWPQTLHSSEEKLAMLMKIKPFNGGLKETHEEPQKRDPSPRTDGHEIDIACTKRNNKITVYTLH